MPKQSGKLIWLLVFTCLLAFSGMACKSQDEIEDMMTSQNKSTQEIVIKQEVVREKNVLTVTGAGKKDVDPDIATVRLCVVVHDETAEDARLRNNERMAEVLDAIKSKGIRDTHITTQEITIAPEQDEQKSAQEITGYSATSTISIRILQVKRTGEVIDAAVQAGANVVLPLEFYLLDETAHYQDALKSAMEDAMAKAQLLAEAGNFKIVGALSVVEELEAGANTPNVLLYEGIVPGARQPSEETPEKAQEGDAPEKAQEGESAAPMLLQAGQLTVGAQVTVELEYVWLPAQTAAQ